MIKKKEKDSGTRDFRLKRFFNLKLKSKVLLMICNTCCFNFHFSSGINFNPCS